MKAVYNLSSEKKRELIVWIIATVSVILVVILIFLFISFKKNKELKTLENAKISLQENVSNLEKELVSKKLTAKNKEHLKKVFTKLLRYADQENKSFMSKILADLASNIPPSIFLSQLDCTKKVELLGYAVDVQSVLNLLQILSQLPYISHGKIVHLKTQPTLASSVLGTTAGAASNNPDSLLEFLIRLDIKPDKENVQN